MARTTYNDLLSVGLYLKTVFELNLANVKEFVAQPKLIVEVTNLFEDFTDLRRVVKQISRPFRKPLQANLEML